MQYILASADWNLSGWSRDSSTGFEVVEHVDESAEMLEFLQNIRFIGLPFLDGASDLRRVADCLAREAGPHATAADLYLMLDDRDSALKALIRARDWLKAQRRPWRELEEAVGARFRSFFPECVAIES